MSPRAIDRRVARTRHLLQQAHLKILRSKGYEAMTVQDICDSANVGRSTFYAHFRGKDDLRRSSFEHLRRELTHAQAQCSGSPRIEERCVPFSLALFEHAREYLDLYRAISGTRGGVLGLRTIRKILTDLMGANGELQKQLKESGLPSEAAAQFIVGACMSILTWWLDNGATLPPKEIDATFKRLVCRGLLKSS